jgi:hypothetical protein
VLEPESLREEVLGRLRAQTHDDSGQT